MRDASNKTAHYRPDRLALHADSPSTVVQGALRELMRASTVPVALPDCFEGAAGYDGPARFAALYWTDLSLLLDDGECATEVDAMSLAPFLNHPAVIAAAGTYPFRLSSVGEESAPVWLLDRHARQILSLSYGAAMRVCCANPHVLEQLALGMRRSLSTLQAAGAAAAAAPNSLLRLLFERRSSTRAVPCGCPSERRRAGIKLGDWCARHL